MTGSGRNLQLLGLAPPVWRQPDIHEEIAALRAELAKGEAVYSIDELHYLERKLTERLELLRTLTSG